MRHSFGLAAPLVVSVALHASAVGWFALGPGVSSTGPASSRPAVDPWVGETVEVTTTAVKDDEEVAAAGQDEPQASSPSPPSPPSPPPVSVPTPAVPPKLVAKPPPKVAVSAPKAEPDTDAESQSVSEPTEATAPQPVLAQAPKASAADSTDLASAMRAAAASGGNPSGGSYGAVGVDLRERNLFRALVRALPVAVRGDQGWWRWSMGEVGRARFRVTLDEGGRITDTEQLPPKGHPRAFALVSRMAALLRAGHFALPEGRESGGQQVFELSLRMGQSEASQQVSGGPGDVIEMGFEAPASSREGRAWIREASGKKLLGVIRRDGAQPAARRADEAHRDTPSIPAPAGGSASEP